MVISNTTGVVQFFHIDPKYCEINQLPTYWNEIGSLKRNHISKHFPSLPDSAIIKSNLTSKTLDEFIRQEVKDHVDVLHIDAEGYDYKILSTLSFMDDKPEIVLIEHKHLPLFELALLRIKMKIFGYRTFRNKSDFLFKSERG